MQRHPAPHANADAGDLGASDEHPDLAMAPIALDAEPAK